MESVFDELLHAISEGTYVNDSLDSVDLVDLHHNHHAEIHTTTSSIVSSKHEDEEEEEEEEDISESIDEVFSMDGYRNGEEDELMNLFFETEREVKKQLATLRANDVFLKQKAMKMTEHEGYQSPRKEEAVYETKNGHSDGNKINSSAVQIRKQGSLSKKHTISKVGVSTSQRRRRRKSDILAAAMQPIVPRNKGYQATLNAIRDERKVFRSTSKKSNVKDDEETDFTEQMNLLKGELRRISSMSQLALNRPVDIRKQLSFDLKRNDDLDFCNMELDSELVDDVSEEVLQSGNDKPTHTSDKSSRQIFDSGEEISKKIEDMNQRLQSVGRQLTPVGSPISQKAFAERGLALARNKFQQSMTDLSTDLKKGDGNNGRSSPVRRRPLRYDPDELRKKEQIRARLVRKALMKKRRDEKRRIEEQVLDEIERQRRLEHLERVVEEINKPLRRTQGHSNQGRISKSEKPSHNQQHLQQSFSNNKQERDIEVNRISSRPSRVIPCSIMPEQRMETTLESIPNDKQELLNRTEPATTDKRIIDKMHTRKENQAKHDSEDERERAMKRAQKLALKAEIRRRKKLERAERRRRKEENEIIRRRRESVSALVEKIKMSRTNPAILKTGFRQTMEHGKPGLKYRKRSRSRSSKEQSIEVMEIKSIDNDTTDDLDMETSHEETQEMKSEIEWYLPSDEIQKQLEELDKLQQDIQKKREELLKRNASINHLYPPPPLPPSSLYQSDQISHSISCDDEHISQLEHNDNDQSEEKSRRQNEMENARKEESNHQQEAELLSLSFGEKGGSVKMMHQIPSSVDSQEDQSFRESSPKSSPTKDIATENTNQEEECQDILEIAENSKKEDLKNTKNELENHNMRYERRRLMRNSRGFRSSSSLLSSLHESEDLGDVLIVHTPRPFHSSVSESRLMMTPMISYSRVETAFNLQMQDTETEKSLLQENVSSLGCDKTKIHLPTTDSATSLVTHNGSNQPLPNEVDSSELKNPKDEEILVVTEETKLELPPRAYDLSLLQHKMLKYTKGGKGKSHERIFFVDVDSNELCWSDRPSGGRVRRVPIHSVEHGLQVKKRAISEEVNSRSFTVNGEGNSVFITAPDIVTCNTWTQALQWHLQRNFAISQPMVNTQQLKSDQEARVSDGTEESSNQHVPSD